jgi:glucose-1-phosphatase
MPSLLLFDLGGVLINSKVFEHLRALLPDAPDQATLKQRWLDSPSVRRFERGESEAAAFAHEFTAEWQIDLSAEAFLQAFSSWPRGFFPGACAAIQQLRQSYTVGCLTNSNPIHWQQIDAIDEVFDITLCSHLLGAIKPDTEIFDLALQKCGVAAERVYFFDDSPSNVAAARQIGMTAFVTEDFEDLQQILARQNLL